MTGQPRTRRRLVLTLLPGLIGLLSVPFVQARGSDGGGLVAAIGRGASADAPEGCTGERWVATWTGAPQGSSLGRPDHVLLGEADGLARTFVDQTLRMVVSPRTAGTAVRVRIGNRFGTDPVTLDAVTLATHWSGASAVPGSMGALSFDGARTVTVPAGAEVLSDPVSLPVRPFERLLVSFHVSGTGVVDHHQRALATSYAAPERSGDHADDESGAAFSEELTGWYGVTGVEVLAPRSVGVVVTLGDSITDGFGSSPNLDRRWPDRLAQRLLDAGMSLSVVNAAISGNHVVTSGLTSGFAIGPSATERVHLDALRVSGVTDLFVFEGINDIYMAPPGTDIAAQIIAGYQSIIDAARAAGLRVVGSTVTPASMPPEKEAARLAVNEWIRTSGGFDAIVDFDAVTRDPADPSRLRPDWDAGMAHLNDAGYAAMGDAVPLDVFQGTGCE